MSDETVSVTVPEGTNVVGVLTITAEAEVITAGQKVLALLRFADDALGSGRMLDPTEVIAILNGDLSIVED